MPANCHCHLVPFPGNVLQLVSVPAQQELYLPHVDQSGTGNAQNNDVLPVDLVVLHQAGDGAAVASLGHDTYLSLHAGQECAEVVHYERVDDQAVSIVLVAGYYRGGAELDASFLVAKDTVDPALLEQVPGLLA